MPINPQKEFDALLKRLADNTCEIQRIIENDLPDFSEGQLQIRDRKLASIAETLNQARYNLDPAKHEIIAISLGRPDALSRFFAFSFIEKDRMEFAEIGDSKFYGSGVYALYYNASAVDAYRPISGSETPIYVGKAIPDSPTAETAFDQGPAIWKRLKEHRRSIVAGDLDPAHFRYRYAVIQSGMESAVEDFMIRLFKPIWNKEIKVCHGIGKHGDAATTRANKRSPWDTMHPGRRWAKDTKKDQASKSQILAKIAKHFDENPPIPDKDALYQELAL